MMPLRIASVNVNGLRAAVRKGMHDWLADCAPDVLTLQEVRAPDSLVAELLGDGWQVVHAEASAKGRAGVAIATREPVSAWRDGVDETCFADTGRWIEADLARPDGSRLTIVSAYVHTGDAELEDKMAAKYAFLDAMGQRLRELRDEADHAVVTGDFNIAHREVDIKNWKGNRNSAGFLPAERAHLDHWFDDLGWVDVIRDRCGDGPGPYTWWSYRGRAYDNDAGWRIDYQLCTPDLAATVTDAYVDRRGAYAERWSDHAPVVVTYAA